MYTIAVDKIQAFSCENFKWHLLATVLKITHVDEVVFLE